jgi:hypothetical protein
LQDLDLAEKKAAEINAELIKSGKVVLKKPSPRKIHRPRKNPPPNANAAAPPTIAASDKKTTA